MLKVDLGGYAVNNPEWVTVNIDSDLRAAPDHLADIRASAGELDALFEPESIDMIRCIHTLEHLPSSETLPSLSYWRRFLKPGGKLLIVVPSLGEMALDYVDGNLPFEVLAAVTYVPPKRIKGKETELHKWGWDAHTLAADLKAAGYKNVTIADDDWWPASWTLDYEDMAHTGLVGAYEVPNLRMLAEA